ncbi:globin domain-containing protein [Flaviaesturariibacter amylovorans]|uniref:Globin family protein n=1 Tax=Flaviaesturariibacter amylovorans TaxID=1084520 RepID=A0ABP8GFD8_9BACT
MNQQQIALVKETWSTVAALDPLVVGDLFYNRLFTIIPEVRPMFRGDIPEQSKKLLHMLHYVIRKLDRLDDIMDEVRKLAQRHVGYGVQATHYHSVGSALLWTLEQGLGEAWTEEAQEAWIACYTLLAGAMIGASAYEVAAA